MVCKAHLQFQNLAPWLPIILKASNCSPNTQKVIIDKTLNFSPHYSQAWSLVIVNVLMLACEQ